MMKIILRDRFEGKKNGQGEEVQVLVEYQFFSRLTLDTIEGMGNIIQNVH